MKKEIYTLHERGAESHFYALEELCRREGYTLLHREISQLPALKQLFTRWSLKIFVNIVFLVWIPFAHRRKVVLGVAPYNPLLPLLMWMLRRHEVYYFTSYTCWNLSMSVYPLRSQRMLDRWQEFASSYVKHIFAVSNRTKCELVKNRFSTPERISVVYHSIKEVTQDNSPHKKSMSFVCMGRLVSEKGILPTLELFSRHPQWSVTFVGEGALKGDVERYAERYENISYAGYVADREQVVAIYRAHSFVLQNSQRLPDSTWAELFGIAIVEGMACGCVAVSTNHTGPCEIITNGVNGLIYRAEEFEKTLEAIESMSRGEYQRLRRGALSKSRKFFTSEVASRWRAIL